MKQRTILMMLLISGALNSCHEIEGEHPNYFEHVYINETSHMIHIHSYSYDDFYDNHDWTINPNDSIRINNLENAGQVPVPAECDSVLVTFDNDKSIMVSNGEWIICNYDQERVSVNFTILRHYITNEMYDSAAWLIPSTIQNVAGNICVLNSNSSLKSL